MSVIPALLHVLQGNTYFAAEQDNKVSILSHFRFFHHKTLKCNRFAWSLTTFPRSRSLRLRGSPPDAQLLRTAARLITQALVTLAWEAGLLLHAIERQRERVTGQAMDRLQYLYDSVFRILLILLVLGNPAIMPAEARCGRIPAGEPGSTIFLTFENDIVAGTDYGYTGGAQVSWISPELHRESPRGRRSALVRLPLMNEPGYRRNISISLGQMIHTPRNIEYPGVIDDDRPYSGITYVSVGVHRMNARIQDTISFAMGILGPHSYAEYLQDKAHDTFKSVKPNGWENQLGDELLLNVYVERKWRTAHCRVREHLEMDVISFLGISLGNALSAGNTGFQARLGPELPHDFGTYPIHPGFRNSSPMSGEDPRFFRKLPDLSLHVFAGVSGYAVARDITLDGNSFQNSHRIEKKPFVLEATAGLGILFSRFKITYAHAYRTPSFKEQHRGQAFGSVTITYSF